MKKAIATILSLLVTTSTFADTGCKGLANTSWTGQVKLINGQVVKINKITITSIESMGEMFKVNGKMDGEQINGMFGCTERPKGKIASISFDSNSSSLSSINVGPSKMLRLFGRWKGKFIDTTTEPGKNYLQKI